MSAIPAQSSLVTDEQAYTIECGYCSAKVGEQCINVRSLADSTREPQYYSAGVHRARIKAYKALIVLTDGYFYHTAEMDPNKPVIWLIYDNPHWQPPFGKAVYFDN